MPAKQLDTADLKGVEVLATGTWTDANGNTDEYTEQHLDEMVQAYNELKGTIDPPGKLGHDKGQKLAQEDGFPAIGWVSNLYRQGGKLLADFAKVPRKVAEIISAGGYDKVSSEVRFDPEIKGKKYSRVLTAVAFLGDQLPAVKDIKSISQVAELYADLGGEAHYAERALKDMDPNVGGGVDRDKLKDSDFVFGDDRAFPIVTSGDVSDAVNSWGRYKGSHSFDEFKSRLTALAKRKGFTSSLPDKWTEDKKNADGDRKPAPGDEDDDEDDGSMGDALSELDDYMSKLETRIAGQRGAKMMRTFLGASRKQLAAMKLNSGKAKDPFHGSEDNEMDIKKLAEALELPETATEADVLKAIAERKAEPKQSALSEQETRELRDKVGSLERDLAERTATAAVEDGMKAGKLLPAQQKWAHEYALKDPEGFRSYIEQTPKVPILGGPLGYEGETSGSDADRELSDSELAIRRQLGTLAPSDASLKRAKSGRPSSEVLRENAEKQREKVPA